MTAVGIVIDWIYELTYFSASLSMLHPIESGRCCAKLTDNIDANVPFCEYFLHKNRKSLVEATGHSSPIQPMHPPKSLPRRIYSGLHRTMKNLQNWHIRLLASRLTPWICLVSLLVAWILAGIGISRINVSFSPSKSMLRSSPAILTIDFVENRVFLHLFEMTVLLQRPVDVQNRSQIDEYHDFMRKVHENVVDLLPEFTVDYLQLYLDYCRQKSEDISNFMGFGSRLFDDIVDVNYVDYDLLEDFAQDFPQFAVGFKYSKSKSG